MIIINIIQFFKRQYYKTKYYSKSINLKSGCIIGGLHTVFEGNNVVGNNSIFSGKIGYGSYLGSNCDIQGEIGRYCSIANCVKVIAGNHPTDTFVSTHPCFFSDKKQAGFTYVDKTIFDELSYSKNNYYVTIGNDVWIGSDVLILNGITVGDGAIIATGSVVVKDVEPYSIVGGVPARHIKYRFSKEEIDFLNDIQWWNMPEEWIIQKTQYFKNIKDFMKECDEE